MNRENVNYLRETIRYMGFGDKLYAELEKNIQQGFPEFVLKMHPEFNGQKLDAILFFRRPDGSSHYFFNRYDAVLRNDVGTFEQSFYLNKGRGVTLKEAFNLLQGRAVYKEMEGREGQKYHAWIELDFGRKENGSYKIKQYHENYGYDLESALSQFPVKELHEEKQKERLLLSLQKGNRQSVTMVVDGRDNVFFVQANPQFKTIVVFDGGTARQLNADEKKQLLGPEGRKQLNGKKVEGGQQGKELKHDQGDPMPNKQITDKNEAFFNPQKEKESGLYL